MSSPATVAVSTEALSPALLDTEGASAYLAVSAKTLEILRSKREGPPFRRIGRSVRYEVTALNEWISHLPTGGGLQ